MTRKQLLTPHFSVPEMVRSRTAKKRGIDNTPDDGAMQGLRRLCEYLELVRAKVGGPIKVTSGFRCLELNRALGSSDNSFHVTGHACDIKARGMTNQELAVICASISLVDKVIEERLGRRVPWCHCQISRPGMIPRQEWYCARKVKGKTVYIPVGPDFVYND